MEITADQVLALAPDPASAAAGKKVAKAAAWKSLGASPTVLWGECQGSALYQVRVDRSDLAIKCSCPSRKFPCKHGLGLLLLSAEAPAALPEATPPEWVSEWIGRRAASAGKREARKAEETSEVTQGDVAAQARRSDRRLHSVNQGLDGLDLWLNDLMRNGLAGLETQPATFWERQAARMVDAQAPGIASRLRRLSEIPNSGPDWPRRLLDGLGRLALLTHAFRRIDALEPLLQEDVRAAIGWALKEDEVIARGETVTDDWTVLGQYVTQEDRLRVQRTWLAGKRTSRDALLLQFAVGNAPFGPTFLPDTHQEATLVYWPSAYPQRALVRSRQGMPQATVDRLPGVESLEEFLHGVARATASQPWLDRFVCALRGVVPATADGGRRWWVQDRAGAALLLAPGEYWTSLAVSGGAPIDLTGEWNGETLAILRAGGPTRLL